MRLLRNPLALFYLVMLTLNIVVIWQVIVGAQVLSRFELDLASPSVCMDAYTSRDISGYYTGENSGIGNFLYIASTFGGLWLLAFIIVTAFIASRHFDAATQTLSRTRSLLLAAGVASIIALLLLSPVLSALGCALE